MKGRLLFLMVFGLIGCGGKFELKPPVQLPTRTELRKKIEGMNKNQLLQALGKPDKTSEASADYQVWYYRRDMAKDEVTGKPCRLMIDIKNGKAVDLQFH